MRGHEGRAALACLAQSLLEPVVDADELPQAQRKRMRCERGFELVVRELDAWKDEHAVERLGPCGLAVELSEVGGEVAFMHARRKLGQPPGFPRPLPLVRFADRRLQRRIIGPNNVIRHAEHIETEAAVEVDELSDGQDSVAPGRMRMELAEKRLELRPHASSVAAVQPALGVQVAVLR